MTPLISICIPAYKNIHYLNRLLWSIEQQTFKNFEVIITDDSDDSSVQNYLQQNNYSFVINYKKNEPALGMPANWNYCIGLAKGEWIKIIHDDDWFSNHESLGEFARHTNTQHKFIFSAYINIYESDNREQPVYLNGRWKKRILKHPSGLYANNVIGPPSVTLVHRSILIQYDLNLKWRVDIDYYMRLLQSEKTFHYINKPLMKVGLSEEQVTASCFNNPNVEVPETLYLLQKFGTNILKNLWTYDGVWRLFRNINTYSIDILNGYNKNYPVPDVIKQMLKHIGKTKKTWLKYGVYSKSMMFLSYLKNQ